LYTRRETFDIEAFHGGWWVVTSKKTVWPVLASGAATTGELKQLDGCYVKRDRQDELGASGLEVETAKVAVSLLAKVFT
jgi:hypothetical protein